ncbi:cytochrome P450 [Corynebacterium hylobatis]|uniref:Cytochrome P450 n=1 Tax=Corynebacterium hylobatis TaxID=1859290 RepID=A0A3R9ZCD1_9CORY|nr:cytochrome P450 [Corynebacterium hylobatis]RSZ61559.1 cytochrome P450 [Corynebacterium hylobatis]
MHTDPTGRDPRKFGDELLAPPRCPVAHAPDGEVLVLGHAEAVEVAADPQRFSSAVSAHMQLPNGLDGEEHARFRTLIDAYLEPAVVEKHEDAFRRTAHHVAAEALAADSVDAVLDIGARFAVRSMTAWLGWPEEFEERLLAWVVENFAATRSGDRSRTAAVAAEFDGIIAEVVRPRLENPAAFDDVTCQLVHDTSLGRKLEFPEIVSILRNWTGGDLGSMALSIGVILHALAHEPELQERLRQGVAREEFTAIADELLRRDNPFVSNRRITTCPVTLGGAELPEGQRVRIHWTAANRDPEKFADPDAFLPAENAAANLVWGTGPHYCPGKPLSMLELRAMIEELLALAHVSSADGETVRALHPVGGWRRFPVELKAT